MRLSDFQISLASWDYIAMSVSGASCYLVSCTNMLTIVICSLFIQCPSSMMETGWFFFFQAEDGIRDIDVTGVQTCALPISDSDDSLPQLTCGRHINVCLLQFSPYVAIFQMRNKLLMKPIDNSRNEIFILPILLKSALTVTIFARFIIETYDIPRSYLYRLNLYNQVFHLGPIGSDILHGTRTDLPGDERQIFRAIHLMRNGIGYHIIKLRSGPTFQVDSGFVLVHLLHAKTGFRRNDQPRKIFCQQQIATATDNQEFAGSTYLPRGFLGFGHTVINDKTVAKGLYSKCVVISKIIISNFSHASFLHR